MVQADYFYVVQSGSFQVSKTEAAASAEKILDLLGVSKLASDFEEHKTCLLFCTFTKIYMHLGHVRVGVNQVNASFIR